MTTIKAPYNFVPFNKDVVSPHWIEQISHDIPFEDGLSGTIDVMLKAETPIFVRDGIGQKQAKDNYQDDVQQKTHLFSQYDGRYFIPGTSIKGMIRNILEILSFGRMEGKVNDHRYAIRDFHNDKIYPKSKISNSVKCGWLEQINGEYLLTDCGKPRRISHEVLSEYFKVDISDFFQKKSNLGNKSAKMKYEKYSSVAGKYQFESWDDNNGRPLCKVNSAGTFSGTIVFTGQPSERVPENGEGKHLEFVFPDLGTKAKPISDHAIQNFFFAYYDHDKNKQSLDWKYWKPKLDDGKKIPVFFREVNGEVKDMGLSMLYKIANENSVIDAIKYYHGETKPDLSETIFGHVNKEKALKGRVHIGHAFSTHAEVDSERKEVLSGPKASYYPTYMHQNLSNAGVISKYNTFMDKGAKIAGWKRYPIHANGVKHNPPPAGTNSEKILTIFTPLKAGAEFTFSIRYHNLRPVELGALLSTLTFHGTEKAFHSIGMAKPLGYGKVSLTISNADQLDIPKYLGTFEAYMNAQMEMKEPKWHTLDQVTELVTMAQEHSEADLSYMKLTEHLQAKRDKEGLAQYSKLVSKKAAVTSFSDANAIAAMKAAIDEEIKSYLHTDNIGEIVQMSRNAVKQEMESLWSANKAQLLEQLKAKQMEIAQAEQEARTAQVAEERAKKKEEERQKAQSEGPGLDQVDISNWRSAKENLIKTVEAYGRRYYKQSDIKKIIQQNPFGYLPAQYHDQLFEILQKIYQTLNIKEKEKWSTPYPENAILKKVAEWVGEDKAKKITLK